MRTAIVKFSNGNSITTGINGTDEEIREYYKIGKVFNLGDGAGNDLMASVKEVEISPISETLKRINGNKQEYTIGLPKIVILGDKWNDTALEHIHEETGLHFNNTHWQGMEAQPENSQQIVQLLLTYNFKTQYHDNADSHNTLYLKQDHHVGFQVDSICYDCCKENGISVNGLKKGDRLSC